MSAAVARPGGAWACVFPTGYPLGVRVGVDRVVELLRCLGDECGAQRAVQVLPLVVDLDRDARRLRRLGVHAVDLAGAVVVSAPAPG